MPGVSPGGGPRGCPGGPQTLPRPPVHYLPLLAAPARRQFLLSSLTSLLISCLFPLGGHGAAAPGGTLQQQVSERLRSLRTQGRMARDEVSSWSVQDLTTGTDLVALSQDIPRQAASMIKPFVAQAYFFQVAASGGRVGYGDHIRALMVRSIRDSDNAATNQLMRLVIYQAKGKGPPDVERVLRDHAPHIFRETHIVETIPANGQTYLNKASAADYRRFLHALWNGHLPHAAELRSLMALPNRDRITDGVRSVPDHLTVYDKTGSTARLCGDMGIVEAIGRNGRHYPYIFVGIIEKGSRARDYGRWIHDRGKVLREVSELVYNDLKERHDLI